MKVKESLCNAYLTTLQRHYHDVGFPSRVPPGAAITRSVGPSLRTIPCKLAETRLVSLWWAILALSASGVGLQSCPDRFPRSIRLAYNGYLDLEFIFFNESEDQS